VGWVGDIIHPRFWLGGHSAFGRTNNWPVCSLILRKVSYIIDATRCQTRWREGCGPPENFGVAPPIIGGATPKFSGGPHPSLHLVCPMVVTDEMLTVVYSQPTWSGRLFITLICLISTFFINQLSNRRSGREYRGEERGEELCTVQF